MAANLVDLMAENSAVLSVGLKAVLMVEMSVVGKVVQKAD